MKKLKFVFIGFFVVSFLSCAHRSTSTRQPSFVSKHATEATLTFSHRVRLQHFLEPTKERALEQVEAQLQHLFGPLERGEFVAAPKEDHQIKITSIRSFDTKQFMWEVAYDYKGTIVIEKGPRTRFQVILPINPDRIYQEAMDEKGLVNHCTDEHYQSEGDFWYFWSPAPVYPNCKLKEGQHYEVVDASIERIKPESKTTYPEYHRLVKNNVIDIHVYFGMDDPDKVRDPKTSRDLNATNYRRTRKALMEDLQFTLRPWSDEEIIKVTGSKPGYIPHVDELTKTYPSGLKVRVQMFFGVTGMDEKGVVAFHRFFRQSLKNSAIMIYDGHSGLGGNLDLELMARIGGLRKPIELGADRYQIFYFNSCTSYTYYNSLYFQRKRDSQRGGVVAKGTKDLDILANGLATAFDVMQDTNMRILRAVDLWAYNKTWTSYQRLAADIDSENLFSVIGDEDNPTRPVRN